MAFVPPSAGGTFEDFELGTKQMAEAMTDGTVETAAVMLPFDEQLFELHCRFATDRLDAAGESSASAGGKTGELCGDYPRAVCVFSGSVPDKRPVRSACGDLQHGTGGGWDGAITDLILAMVRAGGITLLPDSMWRERTADGLVPLPATDPCFLRSGAGRCARRVSEPQLPCGGNALAMEILGIPGM